MDNAPRANTRDWFDEAELERCPLCGETAVPTPDSKLAVRLACEVVWAKDGDPQPF